MTYFEQVMAALAAEFASRGLNCPDGDLLRLYTLLVFTTGTATTLENVHDAWAAWRTVTRPDHPDLVPFADLAPGVAAYDAPYAEAICAAAAALGVKA